MPGRGTLAALAVVGLVGVTQVAVALTGDGLDASADSGADAASTEVSPDVPEREVAFSTWTVRGGTMEAEVSDGAVQVQLVWRTPGSTGVMDPGALQLGVLQWPGVTVVGLEVMVDGGAPLPVLEIEPPTPSPDPVLSDAGSTAPASSNRASFAVERRWSAEVPGGDSLILLYAVRDDTGAAGERRSVRIPVVLVESEPPASAPDVFSARITVPDGWSVLGGFPSGLSIAPSFEGTLVEASLPVLPRTIDLDLTRGDLGLLGRTSPLEAGAMLLIVCAGAWGWRRLTAED